MKYFIRVSIFVIALVFSSAYEMVEDIDDQQYYLVPADSVAHRQRRQTSVDITKSGPGTRVTATHRGTIYNDNVHRLDGQGLVSRQFHPSSPTTTGGALDYNHIPSGSKLNVGAQTTRGFGTDFKASGAANIWRTNNGNTRLDAVGSYSRHYGGIGGTGKADRYGGIQFEHRFP